MKKSTVLLIAAAVMLSSCGTAAQMASSGSGQRFNDGIYSDGPSFRSKEERMVDKAETDALVEKTKASEIYLFGEKKDTVLIPDNMAATIKYDRSLGSTVVSVYENPYDWRNNIDPWYYYSPYSVGSSWYWSRHYNPWYYGGAWAGPYWGYGGFYDPWYYGSFYNPWYYGGWYDPWYYGYAGWYDPWYHMHPHYAGWYGGWYDPYWGHHHHHGHGHGPGHKPDDDRRPNIYTGTRHSTGSDRVFAGSSSLRGGSSVSSRPINRNTASSGATVSSRPTGSKNNVTRTSSAIRDRQTAASKNPATVTSRPSTGSTATVTRTAPGGRTGSAARPSSGTASTGKSSGTARSANHRRPVMSAQGTSSSSSATHNRGFSTYCVVIDIAN